MEYGSIQIHFLGVSVISISTCGRGRIESINDYLEAFMSVQIGSY